MFFTNSDADSDGDSDSENGGDVKVGDKVRVKAKVKVPRYQWGMVSPGNVGILKNIDSDGDVKVDFPEQPGWHGVLKELEKLSDSIAGKGESVE